MIKEENLRLINLICLIKKIPDAPKISLAREFARKSLANSLDKVIFCDKLHPNLSPAGLYGEENIDYTFWSQSLSIGSSVEVRGITHDIAKKIVDNWKDYFDFETTDFKNKGIKKFSDDEILAEANIRGLIN